MASAEPVTVVVRKHISPTQNVSDATIRQGISQSAVEFGATVPWRLPVVSSDAFERVMGDIEGKIVDRVRRQIELRQLAFVASPEVLNEPEPEIEDLFIDIDESDDDEEDEEIINRQQKLKARAQRGWAIIRRYIREESMNKSQKKSSMQWNMLSHTMKQMKNLDASRADLYQKYLNPDNPRFWTNGMKTIPGDFFAKNSRAILKKVSESPEKASERAQSKNKRMTGDDKLITKRSSKLTSFSVYSFVAKSKSYRKTPLKGH